MLAAGRYVQQLLRRRLQHLRFHVSNFNMPSLLADLRSSVLDARDLELVLLAESGGPAREVEGWTEYQTADAESLVYARARFKHGVVSQLEPGPGLLLAGAMQRLLDKARESAASTHGSLIASRVMFSGRPLEGAFSWRDRLRLLPCPPEAPNGQGLDAFAHLGQAPGQHDPDGPPYPMLLQVRVTRSSIPGIESARILRELDRAHYALSVLVAGHLGPAHWPSSRQWVSLRSNERIENHLVHTGFNIGVEARQDDFANHAGPSAELYCGEDYYDRLWFKDRSLLLPSTLGSDLDGAAALSPTDQAAFRRACYWFSLGIQHRTEPSLSVLCFATSIECLLPPADGDRCPHCRKPTVGPTQLFKRHLRKYGKVIPSLESLREDLYGARSSLVHGRFASRIDADFFSAGEHHIQSMLIEVVAQRGIVYWLRDKTPASSCRH